MMILGADVRETGTSVERTKRLRPWAILIVTNLFSLACMAWVLNGAGIQHIWGEVRHMRWSWVTLAVVCDACEWEDWIPQEPFAGVGETAP